MNIIAIALLREERNLSSFLFLGHNQLLGHYQLVVIQRWPGTQAVGYHTELIYKLQLAVVLKY